MSLLVYMCLFMRYDVHVCIPRLCWCVFHVVGACAYFFVNVYLRHVRRAFCCPFLRACTPKWDHVPDEAAGLHQVRDDAPLPAGRAQLDDPAKRERHQRWAIRVSSIAVLILFYDLNQLRKTGWFDSRHGRSRPLQKQQKKATMHPTSWERFSVLCTCTKSYVARSWRVIFSRWSKMPSPGWFPLTSSSQNRRGAS